MLITTGLSLFFLFWSSLFLIDFYLRTTQSATYLAFVERHGLSITPFQIRFFVSQVDHCGGSSGSVPYQSLFGGSSQGRFTSSIQNWTSKSKRVLQLVAAWFSVGALAGLICFVLTPLYLSWLLVYELGNGLTWLRWYYRSTSGSYSSSGSWLGPVFASATVVPPPNSMMNANPDEENFKAALSSLNQPDSGSLFYVPLQEHVQTGITPVIPGVNIPMSHLPLFMLVLVLAGIFHEIGHAIAAVNANVRLKGFGVFLFLVYPGAFTVIETDELSRSSCAQKLRIFSAGIWHNIILALLGLLILWFAPYCLFPFYGYGSGVMIADVNSKSGLAGTTGLQPGHIVTKINQCTVRNASEWTRCLEDLHDRQNPTISPMSRSNVLGLGTNMGYLVQYSKVRPLTASPDKVVNAAGGGEIQCCSEFDNTTMSSHICFQYKQPFIQRTPAEKIQSTKAPPPSTPNMNWAESLGMLKQNAKSRVKRANLKVKPPPTEAELSNAAPGTSRKAKPAAPFFGLRKDEEKRSKGNFSHACLPARQVTDHATCELTDGSGHFKIMPDGYVCVVPALYNGTVLLRFELKNRSRPVLFIGFLSEPLYMIDMMDLTPRSEWIPYWIPQVVELFGKYLVTFSLAMGLLNAVPCYGLDGQFMCSTVVDYFCVQKTPQQRQRIANTIVLCGTTVFSLNVAIGFFKFLFTYWE
ncbi:peptidase family m50 domain-containing protein [Ditylenchus destructor]|uniref:Membrane-bound transcription factor site-2 protease n=1 Tax=Ditylenchus destructor TaxID=166010 RepID=A0AAD4N263_9BILA|nr:peptidase family m50 domain-containing protein [Ditylenchus destructor]